MRMIHSIVLRWLLRAKTPQAMLTCKYLPWLAPLSLQFSFFKYSEVVDLKDDPKADRSISTVSMYLWAFGSHVRLQSDLETIVERRFVVATLVTGVWVRTHSRSEPLSICCKSALNLLLLIIIEIEIEIHKASGSHQAAAIAPVSRS